MTSHTPRVPRQRVDNSYDVPDGLVSVVIPLVNEQASLRELHSRLVEAFTGAGVPFELLFIDDGSTDESPAVLRELAASDDRVTHLALRRNFGKAAALRIGFTEAAGERIVTIDADLQDEPKEIISLLAALDKGFDLASGWKADRQDPWSRRTASRAYNAATRRASGMELQDFNCGLKAYRDECAKELIFYCRGEMHRYLPIYANHLGFRVTEVSVTHHPRKHGSSRYGLERYLRGFLDLGTCVMQTRYDQRPLHALAGLGLGLAAASAALHRVSVKNGHGRMVASGLEALVLAVMVGQLAELHAAGNQQPIPYDVVRDTDPDTATGAEQVRRSQDHESRRGDLVHSD